MKRSAVRSLAHRLARGRLLRVRRGTVPAGVALGTVLVAALAVAGAVGIDPLPGGEGARRVEPREPTDGARSGRQPELRDSLLTPRDLPPGYAPAPRVAPTGTDAPSPGPETQAPPSAPPVSPGLAGSENPELLPGLPLEGLPLDEAPWGDLDGGLGEGLAEGGLGDGRIREGLGVDGWGDEGAPGSGWGSPGDWGSLGDWSSPDSRGDYGFQGRWFRGHGFRGTGSGGTGPGRPDGRSWSGYLSADRIGPLLSVLWHFGPLGAVSPAEAAATRRAAVSKARAVPPMSGR